MFVAGIDVHTTYSVVAVVSNAGEIVHKPVRVPNSEPDRLLNLLEPFRPLEAVVEAFPASARSEAPQRMFTLGLGAAGIEVAPPASPQL